MLSLVLWKEGHPARLLVREHVKKPSSATEDRPREAPCQLIYCQLQHKCIRTSCTTNLHQQFDVHVMELTIIDGCVVNDATACERCKCSQQSRPSTSFVDNMIDLPRRNFIKTKVCDKVPEGCRLPLFSEFPLGGLSERKPPCQKPSRSVQSFRFNTGL